MPVDKTSKSVIYDKYHVFFSFWVRACFQIADGSHFAVQEFLEEFLDGWIVGDGQYCTVIAEANLEHESGYNMQFVLRINEYLEIVEVYVVALLGKVLNGVDLAISWVEKASLPEEKRQVK